MKRTILRLPDELCDRLDQLADQRRAADPIRGCTRAALVRELLTDALASAERARADAEPLAQAPPGP